MSPQSDAFPASWTLLEAVPASWPVLEALLEAVLVLDAVVVLDAVLEVVPASVPATPHTLFVQVSPMRQVPQLTVPPQVSGMVPQLSPAGHAVMGAQPQTFWVPPPPHVSGAVQAGPQFSVVPSQAATVPQLTPVGHVEVQLKSSALELVTSEETESVAKPPASSTSPVPSRVAVGSKRLAVIDAVYAKVPAVGS